MRYVNAYLANAKFKLETLNTHLQQIVEKGDVMITTDMHQAYYSMAMNKESWPYMCWKHRGKYYCSTILTFGLSLAPMYFHKTMRTIVRLCRALMIKVLNYLDDFLWACKPNEKEALVLFVIDLLTSLGWILNNKGNLTPSSSVEFLGMMVDSLKYWVTAPQRKLEQIKTLANEMKAKIDEKQHITVAELQTLSGTIRAASIAIKPASAWTREMNRWIARCEEMNTPYISTRNTHEKYLQQLTTELEFWMEVERYNGASIDNPEHQITVHSDASETGYGGVCGTNKVSGTLPTHLIGRSSTIRDLNGL
jgi:hypothetical protein